LADRQRDGISTGRMEKVCFPSGLRLKEIERELCSTHAIAARYATCVTERVSNLITRRAAVKLRKYRSTGALRWPLPLLDGGKRNESSRGMPLGGAATLGKLKLPAGLRSQFAHNLRRTALYLRLVHCQRGTLRL
jgi:hypothetical protein